MLWETETNGIGEPRETVGTGNKGRENFQEHRVIYTAKYSRVAWKDSKNYPLKYFKCGAHWWTWWKPFQWNSRVRSQIAVGKREGEEVEVEAIALSIKRVTTWDGGRVKGGFYILKAEAWTCSKPAGKRTERERKRLKTLEKESNWGEMGGKGKGSD